MDFGLSLLSLASEHPTWVLDGVGTNIYSEFAAEERGPLGQKAKEYARWISNPGAGGGASLGPAPRQSL